MKHVFAALNSLGLLLLITLLAASCTKKAPSSLSEIRKDFDFLCESQKTFKETLSLKGVNQKELLDEHYKRIFEGLKTIATQAMMSEALLKNPSERRELFLSTAKKLGLESWTCSFL